MLAWLPEDVNGTTLGEYNSSYTIWWPKLCGNGSRSIYDAFWDDSLTIHTYHPDLSDCFQKSALSWLGCGFLWFCSIFYIPYLYRRRGFLFKSCPSQEQGRSQNYNEADGLANHDAALLTSDKASPNGGNGLLEGTEGGTTGLSCSREQYDESGLSADHVIRDGTSRRKRRGQFVDGQKGEEYARSLSRHCMLKLVLATLLACLSLTDIVWYLAHHWSADQHAMPIDYLDSVLHLITYLLAALLTLWSYRKYIHSSSVLFLFWFCQLLISIFILRSLILRALLYRPHRTFTAVTSLLNFVFTSISFLTVLFSDLPPKKSSKNSPTGNTQSANSPTRTFQSVWRQASRSFRGGEGYSEDGVGDGTGDKKVSRGLLESSSSGEHAKSDSSDAEKSPLESGKREFPCPERSASFLSRLFFWWFSHKIYNGWRRTLKTEDIWDIRPQDSSASIVPEFERYWSHQVQKQRQQGVPRPTGSASASPTHGDVRFNSVSSAGSGRVPARSSRDGIRGAETGKGGTGTGKTDSGKGKGDAGKGEEKKCSGGVKKASLLKALSKSFLPFYSVAGLFLITNNLISFINPQLLSRLLSFIQSEDPYLWRGYMYAAAMFLSSVLGVLFMHHHFNITYTTGMRVRTALTAAIYRKALTISPASRKTSTVGEIVNLMSVDVQKCQDACAFLHYCWSAPISVSLTVYFLYRILGPSTFSGLAFMLLVLPANSAVLANKIRAYQRIQMTLKDSRIKLMSQILSGIKILKLYAWEDYFANKILSIREEELKVLRKAAILNSVTYIMWFCSSFIVALLCFATYVLSSPHNILDAQKAFVSLSLIMILNFPLTMLPPAIMYAVQASVSLKRIEKFLLQEDIDPDNVVTDGLGSLDEVISIKEGNFAWGNEEDVAPTLTNINVSVGKGKLVAVVGLVGCGKSSLLSAMLGEMERLSGIVSVTGSVAYVSQQAWIQNLSLRDNILFSRPMNHVTYNRLLDACALRSDLSVLPAGDATEIGERGINLSGGQKQRISLARAVYQDCDIYLLDDTLSAVDAHVGRHIFNNVIGPQGLLRDKTRVWVTHSVSYLPQVDEIIVLKDGVVSEFGSFADLISCRGDFSEFISTYLNEEEELNEPEGGASEEVVSELKEIRKRLDSLSPAHSNHADLTLSNSDIKLLPASPSNMGNSSPDTRLNSSAAISLKSPTGLSESSPKVDSSMALSGVGASAASPEDAESRARISSVHSRTSTAGNTPGSGSRTGGGQNLRRKKSSMASSVKSLGEEEEGGGRRRKGALETEAAALIQQEEAGEGTVKLSVLKTYIQAAKPIYCALTILSLIAFVIFQVSTNIWLSEWTQDKIVNQTQDLPLTRLRLGVYGALGAGQGMSVLCMALSISLGSLWASRRMHASLLRHVLRCPLPTFFDTTPLGRIINRFSKDVDIMDSNLPQFTQNMLMTLAPLISTIIIISYTTPIFIAVVVPLLVFFVFLQRVYVTCARQIKRIDSICRSPLYAFFSETLNGVSAIRAFKQQRRFITQSDLLLDNSQRVWFESFSSNRWIGVWAEFIGDLIILFTAVFAVMQRDQLDSGLVGLSLSFALQVNMAIVFTLRSSCEVETYIVAVERIKEYTEQPTEADWVIPGHRPHVEWPQKGIIEFKNYETSYRPGLDLVLRNLSCNIQSMEKVGLVGRTGAGKSSMTLALFRILEATGGQIIIDGVDISQIGLHDLRRKLTVIPQDPVLFSGSLRFNLDPSDEFTDEEIWRSLEQAHLKRFVESLPENIFHECGEDGENLSVGQRQLVCLARALLRKSKVLILDEATAAVDLETDDLIQATIRAEFKDCTVLTIAHRLNTIIDYEKIIVLEKGGINECGSPSELLNNRASTFYSMAQDAGLVTKG